MKGFRYTVMRCCRKTNGYKNGGVERCGQFFAIPDKQIQKWIDGPDVWAMVGGNKTSVFCSEFYGVIASHG